MLRRPIRDEVKHARRVVELLADVFADPLKLEAARALGVFWLVMDHGARKLRWQSCTFGLLTRFGRRSRRVDLLQLSLDSRDISIKQVVEQAALIRAQLFAALGELVPLEQCDFVAELLDDGLITMDLFAYRVDLRQQLRSEGTQLLRGHLMEVGRGSHTVDFTKADHLRQ